MSAVRCDSVIPSIDNDKYQAGEYRRYDIYIIGASPILVKSIVYVIVYDFPNSFKHLTDTGVILNLVFSREYCIILSEEQKAHQDRNNLCSTLHML